MREDFWSLDPKLCVILCEIDFWAQQFGEEITITSLLRTHDEQARLFHAGYSKFPPGQDIHEYARAADFRPFKSAVSNQLLPSWVNAKWIYDPERPRLRTCVDERDSQNGGHWHIQVLATVPKLHTVEA